MFSWNSLAFSMIQRMLACEELTHWKRLWWWEGLGAGGEGDDRGWDGWMASQTRCTWVCVNSRSWWWTGRPGVLQFMGLQKVGHDWVTELNWTKHCHNSQIFPLSQKQLWKYTDKWYVHLQWNFRGQYTDPISNLDKLPYDEFIPGKTTQKWVWIV